MNDCPNTHLGGTSERPLLAMDLFSGAGGLTEGLKLAGFRVVGAIESDPLAAQTYRLNHSEVHLWEDDIRVLEPAELLSQMGLARGELALLAGCPPCQGYSTLRTKQRSNSVEDIRNDLVYEFVRLTRAFLPKVVMLENVPNLASDRRMQDILGELASLGYQVDQRSIRVLDAADFGVPQRRKRMILLGSRLGVVGFARTLETEANVRSAIGFLPAPGLGDDPLHDYHVRRSARVEQLIAAIPSDGGSRIDLPTHLQLPCHLRTSGFRDVYGRMAWNKVAPTITSGCFNPSRGRFLHPVENRAITLREASLLQTFREDYIFPDNATRQQLATLIGNAFPPQFVKPHAESVATHIREFSQ